MSHDYPFNVNMYKNLPEGMDNLQSLIFSAKARLHLYEILQEYECSPANYEIIDKINESSPFKYLLTIGNSQEHVEARKLDFISHWILRIAYSKYWEDRNVFIAYERRWFTIRFNRMKCEQQEQFMTENGLNPTEVTESERLKIELENGVILNFIHTYFKCNFGEIPELIRDRSCPVINAQAYFTSEQATFWIMEKLSSYLMTSLNHISKSNLPNHLDTLTSMLILVRPPRMLPFPMAFNLEDIDGEADRNFPLCMRFIHKYLRQKHHLKHCARLQYGRFLKGIGLSLDDSLNFWRDEFLKRMSAAKFSGSYTYSIKYNYGKAGRKKDPRSFRCAKILNLPEEENQVHGCPFKTWDEDILVNFLEEEGFADHNIAIIRQSKKEEKYCEACTCYFQAVNRTAADSEIVHPNQYYWNSVKINERCDEETDIEDLLS